jgi:hypothetical protein
MPLVMIAALLALSVSLSTVHGSNTWNDDSEAAYLPTNAQQAGDVKTTAAESLQPAQQPAGSDQRSEAYAVSASLK